MAGCMLRRTPEAVHPKQLSKAARSQRERGREVPAHW